MMLFVVLLLLLSSVVVVTVVSSLALETRRSILTTWRNPSSSTKSTPTVLGWTLERRDSIHQRYQVTVAWTHNDEKEDKESSATSATSTTTTIDLPYLEQADSLASSLWPASLAGAILLQSPAWRQQVQDVNLLELGSGIGLAGLAAAAAAAAASSHVDDSPTERRPHSTTTTCWLTDYDPQAVELLNKSIEKNQDLFVTSSNQQRLSQSQPQQHTVLAQTLDWRDPPELQHLRGSNGKEEQEHNIIQFILGTDVCYYYHLLRPLMDTILRKLQFNPINNTTPISSSDDNNTTTNNNNNKKLVCLIGQANRQSLWDMYHNIGQGCYNQITDEHEPPWPGTTCMLLYQLYIGTWITTTTTTTTTTAMDALEQKDWNNLTTLQPLDGILPMAALVYTHPDSSSSSSPSFSLIQSYDHVANQVDEEAQMKSF